MFLEGFAMILNFVRKISSDYVFGVDGATDPSRMELGDAVVAKALEHQVIEIPLFKTMDGTFPGSKEMEIAARRLWVDICYDTIAAVKRQPVLLEWNRDFMQQGENQQFRLAVVKEVKNEEPTKRPVIAA